MATTSHAAHRPTAASIAAAKQAQQADRERLAQVTGLRFAEDGTPILPPTIHRVCCGLCRYMASAEREGQAINSVAAHIIARHLRTPKE